MPHFVIECSESLIQQVSANEIMNLVYTNAESSGLFAKEGSGGIKVRINPYKHFLTVGSQDDFIHVFGNIMEGRSDEQKKNLSNAIIRALKELLPDCPIISMNIREFEKSSYANKSVV